MTLSIFISYSWTDSSIADEIEKILSPLSIKITRDIYNLKYKSSIKDFMTNAEKHDFLVVIISDSYLKSKNCMYECINYFCNKTGIENILPVVSGLINLSSIEYKVSIIEYWNEILKKEEDLVKNLPDILSAESFIDDLKKTKLIVDNISKYLNTLSDTRYVKHSGTLTDWTPLVEYLRTNLSANDINIVNYIIEIHQLKTYDLKLEKIRDYQLKHGERNELLNLEAIIHADNNNIASSIIILKTLIERDPNNVKYLNNLASVYSENNINKEQAKELLHKAIDLEPNNVNVLINLGNYYFEKRDIALEYFERAYNLEPNNPHIHAAMGYFYLDSQIDLNKAGFLLEEAYNELPNSSIVAQNYGIFLMDIKKDYFKSREAFLRALKLDNNNYIIYYNYGNLMLDLNNYLEAYHAYSKCLLLNSQVGGAFLGLGHVFKKYFQNANQAEFYYLKAIQLSPQNSEYYYNYGILLYENKRYDEALLVFKNAVIFKNEHYEALNFIGIILGYGQNKIDEAIPIFDSILAMDSVNIKALYNKALLLENVDLEKSLLCYENILEIDNSDSEVIKRIIRLIKSKWDNEKITSYLIKLKSKYPGISIEIL